MGILAVQALLLVVWMALQHSNGTMPEVNHRKSKDLEVWVMALTLQKANPLLDDPMQPTSMGFDMNRWVTILLPIQAAWEKVCTKDPDLRKIREALGGMLTLTRDKLKETGYWQPFQESLFL